MACRWSSQTPKILFISRAFRNGSFISTLSLAITSRGLKPRFETSVIVAFFAFSKVSSLSKPQESQRYDMSLRLSFVRCASFTPGAIRRFIRADTSCSLLRGTLLHDILRRYQPPAVGLRQEKRMNFGKRGNAIATLQ